VISRLNQILADMMIRQCSKSKSVIEKDMDRDFFMSATEAKSYGIIDKVLGDK